MSMQKSLTTNKFNRVLQQTQKHLLVRKESLRCLHKRSHPTKSSCRSKAITSKKPSINSKPNFRNSRNSKINVNSKKTYRLNLRINRRLRPRASSPQTNLMTVTRTQLTMYKQLLRSKFLRIQPMLRSGRNPICQRRERNQPIPLIALERPKL